MLADETTAIPIVTGLSVVCICTIVCDERTLELDHRRGCPYFRIYDLPIVSNLWRGVLELARKATRTESDRWPCISVGFAKISLGLSQGV